MTQYNFKLKKCPFCGGKANVYSYVKSAQAECKTCGALIWQPQNYAIKPRNKAMFDVIKKWNARLRK